MFRTTGELITAVLVAIVVIALSFVTCKSDADPGHAWPSSVPRYKRSVGYERLGYNLCLDDLAVKLLPKAPALDQWLYGQELAAVNKLRAQYCVDKPRTVRVSYYRRYHGPASRYECVGMRDWHCAVLGGMRYQVRPALLAGIRLHEGGNDCSSSVPWGVLKYRGKGLRVQAMQAAKIVRRHADKCGWKAWKPSRYWCDWLGGYYTTGHYGRSNRHWGECVWAITQRAGG